MIDFKRFGEWQKNKIFRCLSGGPKIRKIAPEMAPETEKRPRNFVGGIVLGSRGPQGAAPEYTHATQQGREAAEREKKQERKKGPKEKDDLTRPRPVAWRIGRSVSRSVGAGCLVGRSVHRFCLAGSLPMRFQLRVIRNIE